MKADSLNKPRVAIFVEAALHGINLQRYGVQHFASFADVAVIDFRRIYNPAFAKVNEPTPSGVNYFLPDSLNGVFDIMDRFAPELVIDFAQLPSVQVQTRSWLTARQICVVSKVDGKLPAGSFASRACNFIRVALAKDANSSAKIAANSHSSKGVVSDVLASIKITCMPPNVGLFAGSDARRGRSFFAKEAVQIPSLDVLTNLALQGRAPLDETKVLFVDENLAESPDWATLGLVAPVLPDPYYRSLRNLFEFLESKGYEVIVAAHPDRRDEPNLHEKFGQRAVFFGLTAQLTASVAAVLLHQSTAISFAVLNQVPLGFLTNEGIDSSTVGDRIKIMSRLLNRVVINLDHYGPKDIERVFEPASNSRYNRYSKRFLVSPKCDVDGQWGPLDKFLQRQRPHDD